MMSNREVVVENLIKRYPGDVVAVDDVSFKVEAGQVFGFLGPNGAGKSTTIKILTTLGLPTDGRASVGEVGNERFERGRPAILRHLPQRRHAARRNEPRDVRRESS